jgi:hypothetical protein
MLQNAPQSPAKVEFVVKMVAWPIPTVDFSHDFNPKFKVKSCHCSWLREGAGSRKGPPVEKLPAIILPVLVIVLTFLVAPVGCNGFSPSFWRKRINDILNAFVRRKHTQHGPKSYDFDLQRQRCKKLQRH